MTLVIETMTKQCYLDQSSYCLESGLVCRWTSPFHTFFGLVFGPRPNLGEFGDFDFQMPYLDNFLGLCGLTNKSMNTHFVLHQTLDCPVIAVDRVPGICRQARRQPWVSVTDSLEFAAKTALHICWGENCEECLNQSEN